MRLMREVDLANRRVLIREDLNVPLSGGAIANDARIRAALPTLRQAAQAGARVMAMSHLGRPKEGRSDPALSLAPVARRLGELLGRSVRIAEDWPDGIDVAAGEIVMLENIRFQPGETSNDESLGRRLAALCDVFVMDAFAAAHRAHASTHAVARFAPVACAGPLLEAELAALRRVLDEPRPPLVAIVGGAKVSTKLRVLERLGPKVDQLIVGGGIANTFLAAAGRPVGRSLHEAELVPVAANLLARAAERGRSIPLATDVVVARECSATAVTRIVRSDAVADNEMILDIGPESCAHLADLLHDAGTILWNGPVGVFEIDPFSAGTRALARAVADSSAFSVAGGGDTLAAIERFDVAEGLSYVSTGGGAFLEFMEGRTLPALAALAGGCG